MKPKENRLAFDKAAREYFALKAQNPNDGQAAATARMQMWMNGPDRVRALLLEGARRDGLMPLETTEPPVGVQAWDWCDSANEFRARLRVCSRVAAAEELYLLLQDANRLAGEGTAPIEEYAPLLAVEFAAAKAAGTQALGAIMKKGGPA